MRVLDDEAQHFSISNFPNGIAVSTGVEGNGLDRLGQHANGPIAVFSRQQIELCLTVVAPMSNAHGVMFIEMIERRSKVPFLPHKLL